jgi:hypothetical protein
MLHNFRLERTSHAVKITCVCCFNSHVCAGLEDPNKPTSVPQCGGPDLLHQHNCSMLRLNEHCQAVHAPI